MFDGNCRLINPNIIMRVRKERKCLFMPKLLSQLWFLPQIVRRSVKVSPGSVVMIASLPPPESITQPPGCSIIWKYLVFDYWICTLWPMIWPNYPKFRRGEGGFQPPPTLGALRMREGRGGGGTSMQGGIAGDVWVFLSFNHSCRREAVCL